MFNDELEKKRVELTKLLKDFQNDLYNMDENDPLRRMLLEEIIKIKAEIADIDVELSL